MCATNAYYPIKKDLAMNEAEINLELARWMGLPHDNNGYVKYNGIYKKRFTRSIDFCLECFDDIKDSLPGLSCQIYITDMHRDNKSHLYKVVIKRGSARMIDGKGDDLPMIFSECLALLVKRMIKESGAINE